jgi:hypothetical protein
MTRSGSSIRRHPFDRQTLLVVGTARGLPFAQRCRALLDRAAAFERMHQPPEQVTVLGQPVFHLRGKELMFHKHPMDLLGAGQKLETLAALGQLLALEAGVFGVLRDLRR